MIKVSIYEYDKEFEEKKLRKAEYEAGRQDGIEIGKRILLEKIIKKKLKKGKSTEQIADELEEDIKENDDWDGEIPDDSDSLERFSFYYVWIFPTRLFKDFFISLYYFFIHFDNIRIKHVTSIMIEIAAVVKQGLDSPISVLFSFLIS